MRRAGLVILVCLLCAQAGAATSAVADTEPAPLVILWAVDGLEPSAVSPATMPGVSSLVAGTDPDAPTHTWRNTRGVMVAETYPNHAAMLTGADGLGSGILGNTIWDGSRFRDVSAADLEAETLFDTLAAERPEVDTAIAVGDPKIDDLFRDEPYDMRWDPRHAKFTLPIAGYPLDSEVTSAVLGQIEDGADFVFVNTQMVDTFGHLSGPRASTTRQAMREVDRQIGRLIGALRTMGEWDRTLLFVTSDHGMEATPRRFLLPLALLAQGDTGWKADTHGGTALLAKPGATPAEAAAVAERLHRWSAVSEAHATGGPLDAAHPDWRLDGPRAGNVVLTARPGHQLVGFDFMGWLATGTHGGPGALDHWLMLTGGSPMIVPGDDSVHTAGNRDLAPTIASIFGVPAPAQGSGRILSEAVAPEV
ncbi:MAG: alkaline phosphatase family protein [Acidimicrobiia bacterium]|nr:alkaline phosphatase family protein [Acidimicrobiia bacterium]